MAKREVSRNKAQEQAMFALYAALTSMDMGEPVDVKATISGVTDRSYEESPLFVKEVLIQALKHYDEEVSLLEKNMRRWTFKRLNKVEQAILLLAVTQFFYLDEKVEKAVPINVAVELTKKYCDPDKDYKFVNAILDRVLTREE
jgi:N utilization substance protein B